MLNPWGSCRFPHMAARSLLVPIDDWIRQINRDGLPGGHQWPQIPCSEKIETLAFELAT